MSGQPWYRRYSKDFIMGTLGMSLEEKGAYSLILDLIYEHGGPIIDEPRYISGILGCSIKRWKTIREKLISLKKITAENGVISNLRAEKELENSAKLHSKLAENGAKGGHNSAKKKAESKENKEIAQAPLKPRAHKSEPEPDIEGSEDKSSSPSSADIFVLPPWVPTDSWESFMEVRKKLKAADTAKAKKALVKELERLRNLGHDPTELIEKSIRNSWKDIYEPRHGNQGKNITGGHANGAGQPPGNPRKSEWDAEAERLIAQRRAARAENPH